MSLGGISGGSSAPPTLVGSGASHAAGIAPDPGAVAGTTKFLREDASWQVPAAGGKTLFAGQGNNSQIPGGGVARFLCMVGIPSAIGTTEATTQLATIAGTFKNARITTASAQPGDGTFVWTLRVNGVDTAIVVTVTAGALAGAFVDTTHTVTVNAGDLVDWKLVNNSPATISAQFGTYTTELDPS